MRSLPSGDRSSSRWRDNSNSGPADRRSPASMRLRAVFATATELVSASSAPALSHHSTVWTSWRSTNSERKRRGTRARTRKPRVSRARRLTGGERSALRAQLTAGREDVAPLAPPERHRRAAREQPVGETLDGFVARTLPGQLRHGVVRDEVDLAGKRVGDLGQALGVALVVVDAAEKDVLERDAPPGRLRVVLGGAQELAQRVAPVERHEPVAQLVGRRVERERESELEPFAGERVNLRHEPDCRDGDPPSP